MNFVNPFDALNTALKIEELKLVATNQLLIKAEEAESNRLVKSIGNILVKINAYEVQYKEMILQLEKNA